MKPLIATLALFTLASCGPTEKTATEAEDTAAAAAPDRDAQADCISTQFEGNGFTHCTARPDSNRIMMQLNGEDDEPLRSLTALALERDAGDIVFAMNGGMFDDEGQPIGYYVENGKKLHDVNEQEGPGNFHLLPNGIFYGSGDSWHVTTTDQFVKQVKSTPQFATQSGPMLVIDGELHPEIAKDGESKYIRNAVGIDEEGRAHFVITDEPVSFGKLARFMRDELHTPNALYLDGKVSALWVQGADRLDTMTGLGPLIVVRKKPTDDTATATATADDAQ